MSEIETASIEAASTEAAPKRQRTLTGKVVSNKMDKTVVVSVQTRVKHPVLGKFVNRSARYQAHDEHNQYNEGDTVEIAEGRPLSRHKSWTVVRLVEAVRVI
ncbi:30S ribosomal protein S17 [Castellaniella sp.]|uniref:30S ribosomal protein S17 n=1 Tax=Castellaniella sp. TaxID=1955812 RepID=UPI00356ACD6B